MLTIYSFITNRHATEEMHLRWEDKIELAILTGQVLE